MQKRFNPIGLINIITVVLVSQVTIPLFFFITRGFVGTSAIFAVWLFLVMLFKLEKPLTKNLKEIKNQIFLLLIFTIVCLFSYFFVKTTSKSFQYSLVPIIYIIAIIIDNFYKNVYIKNQIFVVKFILLISVIFISISIPRILSEDILLSRQLTSGGLDDSEKLNVLNSGIGGASFYANIAILFFVNLLLLIKLKSKFYYLFLVIMIFGIFISSYSLPMLLLILGIIFYFIFRKKSFNIKTLFLTFLIILVFPVIVEYLYQYSFFEPIINKTEILISGNINQDGRSTLANKSIKTFIDNPFFGIGVPEWGRYEQIGEHSSWIDYIAHYGILGAFPFFLFFLIYLRKQFQLDILLLTCKLLFLISCFINPFITEGSLIFTFIFLSSISINKLKS